MGDAGEGLVDAEARIAERLEERDQERRRSAAAPPAVDPDRAREIESLKLARTELQRQLAATHHATRRAQLEQALAELGRRLDALTA
jgi:galactokinase